MKGKADDNGDSTRGMISIALLAIVSCVVAPFTTVWIPILVAGFIIIDYVGTLAYLLIRKREGNIFLQAFALIDKVNGFDFFRF